MRLLVASAFVLFASPAFAQAPPACEEALKNLDVQKQLVEHSRAQGEATVAPMLAQFQRQIEALKREIEALKKPAEK